MSETGFYGKLPCRGDFMQRRAPQEFVDVWDAWLSECLHV
ncbi:MAG: type VI secretion system-associated protein TagF, partial [Gammaproteobacteria bacterium]|nr:type VI secretion system-associated protein TagF [Gammaproteobacteria bacterium]